MSLATFRFLFPVVVLILATSCSGDRPPMPETKPATKPPLEEKPKTEESPAVADPYPDLPLRKPVVHRALAGEPGADGWCAAKSTYGKFTVEMPGQFSDLSLKMTTTTGGFGAMHTIARKTSDGTEFNVLKTETFGRPPEAVDIPGNMVKDLESKGIAVTRQAVTLAGISGTRLSTRSKVISAELVFLDTPGTSYMLGVQWRTEQPAGFDESIERFFGSFKP